MRIIILAFLVMVYHIGNAQYKKSESQHSLDIQKILGGQREVSVYGGRIDLLTDTYAYEIEFANKWKEAIGQSLWYALQKNKIPGIILIARYGREEKDYKYLLMLNSALKYANLENKIKVIYYPHDLKKSVK